MLDRLLNSDTVKWAEMPPEEKNGIVISSRVRLARDLKQIPFPHRLNAEYGKICEEWFEKTWESCKDQLPQFEWSNPAELTAEEKQLLMEKRIISPQFSEKAENWERLLVKEDGSLSVLFNEEDHLRIQCILPGLSLEECLKQASELDDCLEQVLDYAFSEHLGYLTACPTDLGTGMRASILLHLPAIRIAGQLSKVEQNISRLGINIRGLYGDTSKAFGNLYLISNQVTTGQSEKEICSYVISVANQLVEQEKQIREDLKQKNPYQLKDRIQRADGLLRNAYMLDVAEALSLLSDLRLGVDMGIVDKIPIEVINQMTLMTNPGYLQRRAGKALTVIEKDNLRAKYIQEKLAAQAV